MTIPLIQACYQEDMEVPEAAKEILSEDSENTLQGIKETTNKINSSSVIS